MRNLLLGWAVSLVGLIGASMDANAQWRFPDSFGATDPKLTVLRPARIMSAFMTPRGIFIQGCGWMPSNLQISVTTRPALPQGDGYWTSVEHDSNPACGTFAGYRPIDGFSFLIPVTDAVLRHTGWFHYRHVGLSSEFPEYNRYLDGVVRGASSVSIMNVQSQPLALQ